MARHTTNSNFLFWWLALSLSLHVAGLAWCPAPGSFSPPSPVYLVVDLFSGPAHSGEGSDLNEAPPAGGKPTPSVKNTKQRLPQPPLRSIRKTKSKNDFSLPATISASAEKATRPKSAFQVPAPVSTKTTQQVTADKNVKTPSAPVLEDATEPLTGIQGHMKGTPAATSGSGSGTRGEAVSGQGQSGSGSPVETPMGYGSNPPPPYPSTARRRGWEGEVLLLINVTARGEVSQITVSRSSGYQILDQTALKAVYRWEFQAAERNGQAVAGQVMVPIRFSIKDSK